jgi:hypothetical protein
MIVALISAALALGASGADALRALLGVGAAALAAVALLGRSLRPLSNTASGVLLAWVVLALVQARACADATEGALSAVALLAALCVFAVAHTAVPRRERERVLVAVGAAGTLVAGAALVHMAPGEIASFPLSTPDHLGSWLVLPTLLGVAALCLCAPQGRSARWTIAWFGVVAICAAGIAATRSVVALLAVGVAAGTLLALYRLPSRRGFTAAVALCGLALVSAAPVLHLPGSPDFAAAGFASFGPGAASQDPLTRVAALLLSAAIVLRRVRPLRHGRGSLAAWGGVAAVFCVAPLGLLDSHLEVPAITLTAAGLAGLAWPVAAGHAPTGLRRTRLVLLLLSAGIAAALSVGGPWSVAAAV